MPTTPPASDESASERPRGAGGRPSRAPWRLLARDQTALFLLGLLVLAGVALHYVLPHWTGRRPARKLEPGDRVDYKVDLNRASAAELDLLPDIGPSKANAIVRHRETHGPFERLDDLASVPGISTRLVERLRSLVTLGTPPPRGEPPR